MEDYPKELTTEQRKKLMGEKNYETFQAIYGAEGDIFEDTMEFEVKLNQKARQDTREHIDLAKQVNSLIEAEKGDK